MASLKWERKVTFIILQGLLTKVFLNFNGVEDIAFIAFFLHIDFI